MTEIDEDDVLLVSIHKPHNYAGAAQTLANLRTHLMIPSFWTIHLKVICPEDLDERCRVIGRVKWGYLPNHCYRIQIRCGLSPEALEWTIAHELLEAMLGSYGDFTEQLVGRVKSVSLREHLCEEHQDIRDHHIEWMLRVIFGKHRPVDNEVG